MQNKPTLTHIHTVVNYLKMDLGPKCKTLNYKISRRNLKISKKILGKNFLKSTQSIQDKVG